MERDDPVCKCWSGRVLRAVASAGQWRAIPIGRPVLSHLLPPLHFLACSLSAWCAMGVGGGAASGLGADRSSGGVNPCKDREVEQPRPVTQRYLYLSLVLSFWDVCCTLGVCMWRTASGCGTDCSSGGVNPCKDREFEQPRPVTQSYLYVVTQSYLCLSLVLSFWVVCSALGLCRGPPMLLVPTAQPCQGSRDIWLQSYLYLSHVLSF